MSRNTVLVKKQKGFTLIEVLLAMAITAIAAIMAYQAMDSAGRLAEVVQEEGDDLQKLSSVMNLIAQDFRHIVSRSVRDAEVGSGFKAAFQYDEFALPMLSFTRTGKMNPQVERFQRDHLERVYYHLDDDKLVRSSWAMIDRYEDDEPQTIVLFHDVESFKLDILVLEADISGGSLSSKIKTQTKWVPTSNLEALPNGVTITIQTKRWGPIVRTFELLGTNS